MKKKILLLLAPLFTTSLSTVSAENWVLVHTSTQEKLSYYVDTDWYAPTKVDT